MATPENQDKDSSGLRMQAVAGDQHHHELQIALVNAILEASPDGILVVDANARVISVNRRFFQIWKLGFVGNESSKGIVLANTDDNPILAKVVARVKDAETFVNRVKELYANPSLNDYTEIALKDGRTLERHSTALRGDQDRYLGRVWFFRDITEHIEEENSLAELAHTDPLTGIANRRYFQERANEEYIRAQRLQQPLALMLLDIDYFKRINDEHGHAAGDTVLQSLCAYCGSVLRQIDIFGRFGGDEFAVVLPSTDIAGARTIAERLRQGVEQLAVKTGSGSIKITITGGISVLKQDDVSIDHVLKRADEALYQAKAGGRNRIEECI